MVADKTEKLEDDMVDIKENISSIKTSITHIEHDLDRVSKAIYGNGDIGIIHKLENNSSAIKSLNERINNADVSKNNLDAKLIGVMSIVTIAISTVVTLIVRVAFHI